MRLTSTTWGEPANRRAVCLHGITGNAVGWGRVARHLAAKGFEVIAPDMRGHGNSPRGDMDCTFDAMVEDLRDTVGTDVDLLIGHSFGGTLVTSAVARGRIRARCVLLEDPVLLLDKSDASAIVEAEIASMPVDINQLAIAHPNWPREVVAGRALALHQMFAPTVRSEFVGNAPWDVRVEVTAVARRSVTLIVLPERSPYSDAAEVVRLRASLGDRSVIEVSGAGHSVHWDRPESYLALLDELVRRPDTNWSADKADAQ